MPLIFVGIVAGGLIHQAIHAIHRHERNKQRIHELERRVDELSASK